MSDPVNTANQLLFGFLALQNDFITREQLIAGFTTWIADKSKAIDDILITSSFLVDEDRHILKMLVKKHLDRHGDNPEMSLSTMAGDMATIVPQLFDLGDVDLESTLQPLDTEFETIAPFQNRFPTDRASVNRYQIIRPHAKGGIGEVFLAKDRELQREVALKEIQTRFADDVGSRNRFVLEAEITGSLEHPGIVPIYGMGQYEDGRPYYAMRFVHGASLRDLIDGFYAKSGQQDIKAAVAHNIEWRRLLGLFISVCKAIDYAHSRGVIHRDIKPSNIMAGRFGEALVVDWGLAKIRGRREVDRNNGETTLKPASNDSSSQTYAGAAIGTPAFMSPEQASGNIDEIGTASDIYSLGATLYYLLSGQPAFGHGDVASTLERVKSGDFASPTEVCPQVPKALSAICSKAMSLMPTDRYDTATKLADDLELWLADEPVSVYAGGLSERIGRWMRRNRSLVQTAAIGLVSMTVLSSLAAFVFMNLRAEADMQKHNADRARETAVADRERAETLAETNQKLADDNAKGQKRAMELAENMKVEADKSKRLSDFLIRTFQAADPIGQGAAPGFWPKERGGELTAREMLTLGAERVTSDQELIDHPLSQAAVMDAMGDAFRQLSIFDQAEPLLVDALAIRRRLLKSDHPDLAVSLHNLAWFHHERGNYPQALKLYDEALAIRRTLPGAEGQRLVANTLHNKAWMLANEGWADEAEGMLREAFDIRSKILGNTHRDTVFSQFGLVFVLIEQSKFFDAGIQIASVQGNLSHLKADPRIAEAAFQFALGVINRNLIGLPASEKHLEKALAVCIDALGEDNVYVGVIRCELGTTLQKMGQLEKAAVQYELCMKISREKVALEHPRIGILVARYAELLRDQGRPQDGKAIIQEFLDAQLRRFDPQYGQVVSFACVQAIYLRELEEFDAAAKIFAEVAETIRSSTAGNSGYRYKAELLGNALNQQGLCLLDRKQDLAVATDFFRESIAEHKRSGMTGSSLAYEICWPMLNLVSSLVDLSQFEQAQSALSEVDEPLGQLRGDERKMVRDYYLETQLKLYLASRQFDRVIAPATALQKLRIGDAEELMALCSTLCRVVALIQPSTNDPSANDQATSQQNAIREQATTASIATLKLAIEAGFDMARIDEWNRLKILQNDPRYRQLLGPETAEPEVPAVTNQP